MKETGSVSAFVVSVFLSSHRRFLFLLIYFRSFFCFIQIHEKDLLIRSLHNKHFTEPFANDVIQKKCFRKDYTFIRSPECLRCEPMTFREVLFSLLNAKRMIFLLEIIVFNILWLLRTLGNYPSNQRPIYSSLELESRMYNFQLHSKHLHYHQCSSKFHSKCEFVHSPTDVELFT